MANLEPTIVPHLWHDKDAQEAAEFYVSIFPNSRMTNIAPLGDTPSGDTHAISFELWGQPFMAINGGCWPLHQPLLRHINR